ncbi:DEAD-box ATP-dependent RNA helicase 24-like [Dioscorea cayenensis subsp. rotundata]|uniref:DEAD-box ATP-dependent RNA helicase 24-like n=1 Tax=Dioscorea cayennensis subsp. rotundata TaxID=55577 RepID=A0AB40BYK6_DIOCR|nr:DEAD-box ATP-dependent RNA helicase 24-like [Dioscorea cayenensis subsp. rotundata]XP_039131597.1 DEAD-box ATP-dependent RNA helicase 24-like [Dioscorea cayenensis subsp. rotundata]
MSKRKFGFEGFGINRPSTYSFERSQAPQRLSRPPTTFPTTKTSTTSPTTTPTPPYTAPDGDGEIDPLDAFVEGSHEEIRESPPLSVQPKEKGERFKDEDEDDPVESFLRSKKDIGLALASEALHAGYNSDEEVYAAAKAMDAILVEYDSDDNPIVVDKRKIEPIRLWIVVPLNTNPLIRISMKKSPQFLGSC